MRTTVCFLVILIVLADAQQSKKTPTAHNTEAQRCHQMLHSWLDKSGFPSTNDLSVEELRTRITSLGDCVMAEHLTTGKDLRLAYFTLWWYEARQAAIQDQKAKEVQAQYDALLAALATPAKPPKPASILTVSMMSFGYTIQLSVAGVMENCTAVDGEQLICKKSSDSPTNAYIIAMIATPKSKADDPWTYLIGCTSFSPGCGTIVPGDYEYELSGGGITISGLVLEGKPNEPAHHGLYTILSRW